MPNRDVKLKITAEDDATAIIDRFVAGVQGKFDKAAVSGDRLGQSFDEIKKKLASAALGSEQFGQSMTSVTALLGNLGGAGDSIRDLVAGFGEASDSSKKLEFNLETLASKSQIATGLLAKVSIAAIQFGGKGSDGAKKLNESLSQGIAIAGNLAQVLGTVGTAAAKLKSFGLITAAGGTALATGAAIGAAIGLPFKYFIEHRTEDINEKTREMGVPGAALLRNFPEFRKLEQERDREQQQKQKTVNEWLTEKKNAQAADEQAKRLGISAEDVVKNRLSFKARMLGLEGKIPHQRAGEVDARFGIDPKQAGLFGGPAKSPLFDNWKAARQEAIEQGKIEDTTRKRLELEKQINAQFDKQMQAAKRQMERGMTPVEKFGRDMDEILDQLNQGFLTHKQAFMALAASAGENNPKDKKEKDSRSIAPTGANLTESRFLTRVGSATFQPSSERSQQDILQELRRQYAEMARWNHAQNRQAREQHWENLVRGINGLLKNLGVQGI
jgi:hypothetical protein